MFKLIHLGSIATKVALKASNGHYVVADEAGAADVYGPGLSYPWSMLKVTFVTDKDVRIKGNRNDKYLASDSNGVVTANGDYYSPNEQWTTITVGNGNFAFKSYEFDKYLAVSGRTSLTTNLDRPGRNQIFCFKYCSD